MACGLDRIKPPVLRPVVWLENSKKNLGDFPDGAQKLLGDELQLIQFGGMPKDAKPFKGIGSSVLELAPAIRVGRLSSRIGGSDRHADLCFARLSEGVEEGR
jgi:phage-related protein